MSTAAKGTSRWWEYYGLRYFVGTVAGAVAIVFLSRSADSPLNRSGFRCFNDLSNLGIKELTALAALGFAYCYIASAPMLLLHATRAHLDLKPLRCRPRLFALALVLVVIALLQLAVVEWLSIVWWSDRWLGALLFLTVIVLQAAMIVDLQRNHFGTIILFYDELAQARAKESRAVEGYVESYRHLREHANACAILVLEFVLALALVSAREPLLAVCAVTIWLLPSTYAWVIGSVLEASDNWHHWPGTPTDAGGVPDGQPSAGEPADATRQNIHQS